jgi:hypothetical protein
MPPRRHRPVRRRGQGRRDVRDQVGGVVLAGLGPRHRVAHPAGASRLAQVGVCVVGRAQAPRRVWASVRVGPPPPAGLGLAVVLDPPPTNARRLRARTAAKTWVESVRCRPRALSRPRSRQRGNKPSHRRASAWPASRRGRNSLRTVWSKPRSVNSRDRADLPVDAGPDRVGRLAIGAALGKREDRDHGQAPRRLGGSATGGKARADLRVLENGVEFIAHPEVGMATGKGGAGDPGRFRGDAVGDGRAERPRGPPGVMLGAERRDGPTANLPPVSLKVIGGLGWLRRLRPFRAVLEVVEAGWRHGKPMPTTELISLPY